MSLRCISSSKIERTTESYNLELHAFGLECLGFTAMNKLCVHRCLRCSHTFEKRPANVIYHGTVDCPNCKTKAHTKALIAYNARLKDLGIDFVGLRFCGDKVVHRCLSSVCGKTFKRSRATMLNGKSARCPWCEGSRTLYDIHSYNEVLRKRHIKLLAGAFGGQKEKYKHQCLSCYYVWTAAPSNILHRKSGCPACSQDSADNAYKRKPVQLTGKVVRLQGFEPQALEYLVSVGCNINKLVFTVGDGKPTFRYKFNGSTHLYVPDFYHSRTDRVIEVKSLWTFIGRQFFKKNQAKAKHVLKRHNFVVLVLDRDGKRVKLPNEWYKMSRKQVMHLVGWQYA